MHSLPDARTLLRWMFWSLGLAILSGYNFVLHSVLHADRLARVLFPGNALAQSRLLTLTFYYLAATAILCFVTASGLKRQKTWARIAGSAASGLLLCGFPVLTVFGAIGIYSLFARPRQASDDAWRSQARETAATNDFWARRKQSKILPFITGMAMFFGFQALALLTVYAHAVGMPVWHPGWKWWIYLSVFLFFQTAVHEAGHAVMAWTLFFHLRVISVGPLTFWRDAYGFQYRFDWNRLLDSSGYMGAVPNSDENLWLKQIAVVAAGPVVQLLGGGLWLLLFFLLPGTNLQAWWWVAAFNAVLGICCALSNLLPIGYSDGAMLYHLLRQTPGGESLLQSARISMLQERAAECRGRAQFAQEVELRREALHLAQQRGESNSHAAALSHQALGHALLAMEDWIGAEAEFRKCLAFEAECNVNPALKVNSWAGLQRACLERRWSFEAGRASAAAANVLEERKQGLNRTGWAIIRTMLAMVHVRSANFLAALTETEAALAILPQEKNRLTLRAELHSIQAHALLETGRLEEGLDAARTAAAIQRSTAIPANTRQMALHELAELAERLLNLGQPQLAADMLKEAVEKLEAAGVRATAAQWRIKLAAALRTLERKAEAYYALPEEESLHPVARRQYWAERVQLHLAVRELKDAVDSARRLVELWRAEPAAEAELAFANALLARVLLEQGGAAEAEALARQALPVLENWGHPDSVGCLITFLLASRQKFNQPFENAVKAIESQPLLSRWEKKQRILLERDRIGRMGPVEGTAQWTAAPAPATAAVQ